MRLCASIGAVIFAALWVGCASTAQAQSERVAVVRAPVDVETATALDAANAAFSAAWIAGDIEALLAAYSEVAVVHPPAGGILTTPEQIRGVWTPILNQQRVGHRLEPTLRWRQDDGVVLEMGRWHVSRTVDGQSPWSSGCYTIIWRRGGDQRWRMDYDAWTAPNEHDWACRPR